MRLQRVVLGASNHYGRHYKVTLNPQCGLGFADCPKTGAAVAQINAERASEASVATTGPEQEVEKLITVIGAVIRAAASEKRAGLKELAETLLHQEISTIAESTAPNDGQASSSRLMNPLAPGILILFFGLGFLLIFPLVGAVLTVIGAALMLWGGVMSWARK
jgi:hypothetical protein